MPQSRRHLLAMVVGVGVLAAKPALLAGLPAQRTPQPIPSPNAPNQNFPPGLNGPDQTPPSDNKKTIDPKKQEEIKADIQKLFDLAAELKDQSAKTDINSTLPVTVIKKAQQIEKLAKQIKDLSKG